PGRVLSQRLSRGARGDGRCVEPATFRVSTGRSTAELRTRVARSPPLAAQRVGQTPTVRGSVATPTAFPWTATPGDAVRSPGIEPGMPEGDGVTARLHHQVREPVAPAACPQWGCTAGSPSAPQPSGRVADGPAGVLSEDAS